MSSYLTAEQIETQKALAARDDLPNLLADVVIASAFLTGTPPRDLLAGLAETYKIDNETWIEIVAPELAFALADVSEETP